jgi:hypothetical protein
MKRTDGLDQFVRPLQIEEAETSYFSAPSENLDPDLFHGTTMHGSIKNGILQLLFGFLNEKYLHPDLWTRIWIAGSAISYQWEAQREPGDLDVLIGVDYILFRKAHPDYSGLGDTEISKMLNEDFRENLQPETTNWNGFEVTFYVNPGATDIRTINPYAAYDLTHNEWTVFPKKQGASYSRVGEKLAEGDSTKAKEIVARYSQALSDLQNAQNDPARRNAEFRLQTALMQGSMLFEDIHHSRRYAFNPSGYGYADFYNYRWQAGKRSGAVPALRKMSEYWTAYKAQQSQENYGIDLPDTQTLIRRAATYRNKG